MTNLYRENGFILIKFNLSFYISYSLVYMCSRTYPAYHISYLPDYIYLTLPTNPIYTPPNVLP